MARRTVGGAAVAATGRWTSPDGVRLPAGTAHAWVPGTNQTVCGLALSREHLGRFPHVPWVNVQPVTGVDADEVTELCRRCAAGTGARRKERRWTRTDPRP